MQVATEPAFPFRPWVRNSCRRAMVWGIGVLALLGAITWWFKAPGPAPLGRAFGVLAFYGVIFWLTLFKVWWTAGKPAVVVGEEGLGYRPLHLFSVKTIPYEAIQFCAPRSQTESLRIVHEVKPGEARDFFLNLAVVDGRHAFLDSLGEKLEAAGLFAVPNEVNSWRRLDWLAE